MAIEIVMMDTVQYALNICTLLGYVPADIHDIALGAKENGTAKETKAGIKYFIINEHG